MPKQTTTQPTATSSKGPGVHKTTSQRAHTPRPATAVVLSGRLGDELESHAFQRCRFFFVYLTTIKALEGVSNRLHPATPITALAGLAVKATDQIGTGFREQRPAYQDFPDDDPLVVERVTTRFQRTDAAHFCNLGIKSDFVAMLDLHNVILRGLYEQLKALCKSTRLLPQRVNIGPDKKIDRLHGLLATEILKDTTRPVCSRTRTKAYADEATRILAQYILEKEKKARGVAACAQCYLEAYQKDDFVDGIFASVQGEVAGWCSATGNWDLEPHLISSS